MSEIEVLSTGAVLPWMHERGEASVRAVKRPGPQGVGISEAFWGYNGRDAGFVREAAILIEELGFTSLWMAEHVVSFREMTSKHPYAGARINKGWDALSRGEFDGTITAVALAAVTKNLRFGTYVTILGQRNPVVFARELVTIDHMTSGRFTLGAGVGWAREEYEAIGVPFERRGARIDDCIAAMRALWAHEDSQHEGEFYKFGPLLAYPKPLNGTEVPIFVGGQSLRSIRRAATLGNGLIVYNLGIEHALMCAEVFDAELDAAGRRLEDVGLVLGRRNVAGDAFSMGQPLPEKDLASVWAADAKYVARCKEVGAITEVVLSPRLPTKDYEKWMRRYAETIGLEPRS